MIVGKHLKINKRKKNNNKEKSSRCMPLLRIQPTTSGFKCCIVSGACIRSKYHFNGLKFGILLQEELEKVQKRAARFVTGNYIYETGSMTCILEQLKWESLKI